MVKQYAFRIFTFVVSLAAVMLLSAAHLIALWGMSELGWITFWSVFTLIPMLNVVIAVCEYGVKAFRIILIAVLTVLLSISIYTAKKAVGPLVYCYPLFMVNPALGIAAELFCIFKPYAMHRGTLAEADEMGRCWIEIGMIALTFVLTVIALNLTHDMIVFPAMILIAIPLVRNVFLAIRLKKDSDWMYAQSRKEAVE